MAIEIKEYDGYVPVPIEENENPAKKKPVIKKKPVKKDDKAQSAKIPQ